MLALFGCPCHLHRLNDESAAQSQSLTAFYTAPVVSMSPSGLQGSRFLKKQDLDVKLVFIASGPSAQASCSAEKQMWGSSRILRRRRAIVGRRQSFGDDRSKARSECRDHRRKKGLPAFKDLKGKRLGIDRIGSNPDMFAQAALSRFQIDTLKDLQYVQLGRYRSGNRGSQAGSIDAAIAGRAPRSVRPTAGLQSDCRYYGHEDSFA